MIWRFILSAVALLALSSCEDQPVVAAAPEGSATATTVAVSVETLRNTSATGVWLRPVEGVACRISGEGFATDIIAPATIMVPSQGAVPARFTARCTLDGRTVERSNDCYYGPGEPGSVNDPATGACLRRKLSVLF